MRHYFLNQLRGVLIDDKKRMIENKAQIKQTEKLLKTVGYV